MWRIKVALLYVAVGVLGLAWYAGPGFIIGMWISDWELVGWTTKHWIGGAVAVVINYAWVRLTGRWLREHLDKPMDRAVDWATR